MTAPSPVQSQFHDWSIEVSVQPGALGFATCVAMARHADGHRISASAMDETTVLAIIHDMIMKRTPLAPAHA